MSDTPDSINSLKATRSFSNHVESVTSVAGSKATGFVSDPANTTTDVIDEGKYFAKNATTNVKDAIQGLIDEAMSEIKNKSGIKDFYSLHMLNYCEGDYDHDSSNTTQWPVRTQCTKQKAWFYFNPATFLSNNSDAQNSTDLLNDLKNVGWPDFIQSTINDTEQATRAMFCFYIIAIITTFIAFVGAVYSVFAWRAWVSITVYVCTGVSF